MNLPQQENSIMLLSRSTKLLDVYFAEIKYLGSKKGYLVTQFESQEQYIFEI